MITPGTCSSTAPGSQERPCSAPAVGAPFPCHPWAQGRHGVPILWSHHWWERPLGLMEVCRLQTACSRASSPHSLQDVLPTSCRKKESSAGNKKNKSNSCENLSQSIPWCLRLSWVWTSHGVTLEDPFAHYKWPLIQPYLALNARWSITFVKTHTELSLHHMYPKVLGTPTASSHLERGCGTVSAPSPSCPGKAISEEGKGTLTNDFQRQRL